MDTASRAYSKQNRPVTACAECHRRKRRCDRQIPCQNCVARGVAENCFYQASKVINELETPSKYVRKRQRRQSSQLLDRDILQVSEDSNLSKQVGYSQRPSTNVISSLNQLFQIDDSNQQNTTTAGFSIQQSKWSDFHKLTKILPSATTTQELVQVFFSEANWYFAVLDQYYFDKLHLSWIASSQRLTNPEDACHTALDVSCFPALLFQVLALALQFLPPGAPCRTSLGVKDANAADELSRNFSETGNTVVNLLGRQNPSMTAVQADLMRCAWLKNCGRGSESWYALGNAVRQAQELGLHLHVNKETNSRDLNMEETLKSLWYDEHKRRLWATLFIWESHMALTLGRPRMINAVDCSITAPMDCDFPCEPARTLYTTTCPDERPSSYTLQLVKYETARMIHRMMSVGATHSWLGDYRIIQSFHDEVVELLKNLPPAMRMQDPDLSWDLKYPDIIKQRLQISIVANSFLMALHRPHAPGEIKSRQAAAEAALQALEASHQLFERSQKHHYKIYTLMFYTIDAGIFLAATAAKFPSITFGIRDRVYRVLHQAVTRLSILKERNSAAHIGEQVLTRCVQKLRQLSNHDADAAQSLHSDQMPVNGGFEPALVQAPIAGAVNEFPVSQYSSTVQNSEAIPELDFDPWNGRDLFAEITNATTHAAVWLENMNMMSSLDFNVQDNDFIWDTLFH